LNNIDESNNQGSIREDVFNLHWFNYNFAIK